MKKNKSSRKAVKKSSIPKVLQDIMIDTSGS